ncbi:MAG: winged helix-turn-helix domain-containing protein [Acaryochloridaceae cyanobacterium CSU_3_4]|nr:winged helix-turn-helix domain-containing protein [Acaryochloridaceae cyanobacterium CSU_3_4]
MSSQKFTQPREWSEKDKEIWAANLENLPPNFQYPAIPQQVWLYDLLQSEFRLLVYLATEYVGNQPFDLNFTPKYLQLSQRELARRINLSSASVNVGLPVLAQMKMLERKKLQETVFPIYRNGVRYSSSMAEQLFVLPIQSWRPPWELDQARLEVQKKK